jgi:integrase
MARNGSGVSIFHSEKKGLWVARIELPRRNGERRRKEVTAKTHARLLEKLRGPLKQYHLTGDMPTSSTRLGDYLEYWFENVVLKERTPNTAAGYRSVLWTHVIPEIGNVALDKLTTAHLRRVHTRITSTEKGAHDPPVYLSSTYALNAHRVLSAALTSAERDGLISRNPAALMAAPRKSLKKIDALTVSEAKDVLKLVVKEFGKTGEYDPRPARWATYLLTGARRGEILGLEIDRVTDVLELSWQLQRVANIETAPTDYEYRHIAKGMYWTRPKSSAGWRVIPLVEPLKSILETHLAVMGHNDYGLVFASGKGLPIDPDTETELWERALEKSGITTKHVRLHDLRHSTVDLLYGAGVSEDLIVEIIGHSTRGVTRGYKSPANMKRREAAMLQLSSFLGYEPKRV